MLPQGGGGNGEELKDGPEWWGKGPNVVHLCHENTTGNAHVHLARCCDQIDVAVQDKTGIKIKISLLFPFKKTQCKEVVK